MKDGRNRARLRAFFRSRKKGNDDTQKAESTGFEAESTGVEAESSGVFLAVAKKAAPPSTAVPDPNDIPLLKKEESEPKESKPKKTVQPKKVEPKKVQDSKQVKQTV